MPKPMSRRWGSYCKRSIDLVGSLAGLTIAMPVVGLAATLIRLTMGSPVLFKQERAGKDGQPFTLLKLRSMRHACDPSQQLTPSLDRITWLGRFMRATSIDELPQLWNVLKGEMSLVGPRPLLPEYVPRYSAFQRRRLDVKPGLTGWAQVNGRNVLSWEQRFQLDVWYVDHGSIRLDLLILLMTVWKVLRGEGLQHSRDVTMPFFGGNL